MTYYREKTHTDKMPAETGWIRDLDLPDDVILLSKGFEELYQPQSGACGLTRNINACGDGRVTVKETGCPASHRRRESRV